MGWYEVAERDAVRTDGGLVHIRPVHEADHDGLQALHTGASDRSIYLRFFTVSRRTADAYLATLLRPASADHQALVAIVGGTIVGVVAFERLDDASAEVGLLIDDTFQHEGIGTLLLEHLASAARHAGVRRFEAEVLSENAAMLRVLRDLGFELRMQYEDGVARIGFDLYPGARVVEAMDERERAADAVSLRAILAPRSVAVIGASTRPKSVGHELLHNLLAGGYTGAVYVVNRNHDSVLGVPAVPSPSELPAAPDLAIVAVPAAGVSEVVRACGQRGARGILLISAGFGEAGNDGRARQDEVLGIARRYGMRLVGPNCLGVVNTDPSVRLNATFARLPMRAGSLGLVSQSGALGIAVLAAAERCGLGISQFVSVGNKADVSSNDLLLSWDRDERTSVIALYLESFGNPRKFARIARRVSQRKPIIVIKAGRSAAGQRAGQSHTAAAASSDVVVNALFTQAGVLRVDTMGQMLDAARVFTSSPLPAGPRVAIVGNSGGPEILAADAAVAAGLTVAELAEGTAALIRGSAPGAAATQNPVDLGAGMQAADMAATLRSVLDAADVDAALVVFTETLVAGVDDVLRAVSEVAAGTGKPVVVTHTGGEPRTLDVAGADRRALPIFEFPEPAAAALGLAWRYARIRSTPVPEPTRLRDIDAAGARALLAERLATHTEWLAPEDASRLLVRYRIPLCPQRVVADLDGAARAAAELGYPVAVKLAGGAVHKTDVGGVRLGVRNQRELRAAFTAVRAAGADRAKVLIQPMVTAGTELIIGAIQDRQFGPVVMVGAGGVLADLVSERRFRLAPIAPADVDQMLGGLRINRLLDGYRGQPPVSRTALTDLLVRVSALADDLPAVAELDLNPVICRGDELVVVDAKVRIAPAEQAPDPILRQLRPVPGRGNNAG